MISSSFNTCRIVRRNGQRFTDAFEDEGVEKSSTGTNRWLSSKLCSNSLISWKRHCFLDCGLSVISWELFALLRFVRKSDCFPLFRSQTVDSFPTTSASHPGGEAPTTADAVPWSVRGRWRGSGRGSHHASGGRCQDTRSAWTGRDGCLHREGSGQQWRTTNSPHGNSRKWKAHIVGRD